jgi:hypothetical protein
VLETYYLKTLHELLEGEKQSTLVPIPNYLRAGRMFGKSNGPKKGIFGEYSPQQIQLDFILKTVNCGVLTGYILKCLQNLKNSMDDMKLELLFENAKNTSFNVVYLSPSSCAPLFAPNIVDFD